MAVVYGSSDGLGTSRSKETISKIDTPQLLQ